MHKHKTFIKKDISLCVFYKIILLNAIMPKHLQFTLKIQMNYFN